MKVLFDTNVVLDLLLERKPFVQHSELLFAEVEKGSITGYLSATTITTIFYLATKAVNIKAANQMVSGLLELFDVAAVNRLVLEDALSLKFPDFEDAVLHEAARHAGAQAIVTRNENDFQKATLAIYTPIELVKILTSVLTVK